MSRHLHIYLLYSNWIRGWKSTNRKVSIFFFFYEHTYWYVALCGGCFAFGAPHDVFLDVTCSVLRFSLYRSRYLPGARMVHNRAKYKSMPETTTSPIHIGKISLNYTRIAIACKTGTSRSKIKFWMKCRHFVRNNANQQYLAGIDSQPNNKVILFITFFFALFYSCQPAGWGKENIWCLYVYVDSQESIGNSVGMRCKRQHKYATI